MEVQEKLTKSQRKFIRSEKARIRAVFLDTKKQEEMIQQLYQTLNGQMPIQGEGQSSAVQPAVKKEKKASAEAKKKTKKAKSKKKHEGKKNKA